MRILFLLILINLSGCLEKPETRMFQQAEKARLAGENERSITLFQKLIQSSADLKIKVTSAEKLVNIYESLGQTEKQIQSLQEIVLLSDASNQRLKAKQTIADLFFDKLKNYSSAVIHYSELIDQEYRKEKNQIMLARSYYYLNNFDQGLFELKELIEKSKSMENRFEGLKLKADIYFAKKEYEKAMALYNQLLEDYPKPSQDNFVLLNLAMSQEESGLYQEAVSSLKKLQPFYHSPEFLQAKIHHIENKIRLLPGGKGRLKK